MTEEIRNRASLTDIDAGNPEAKAEAARLRAALADEPAELETATPTAPLEKAVPAKKGK